MGTSPQKSTLITHAWLPILLRPCSHITLGRLHYYFF